METRKARIEELVSRILSRKHNAKIIVRFRKEGKKNDRYKSRTIGEE